MIAVLGKTRAHFAFHNSTFILAITALSMRSDASHQPSTSPICRFVSAGVHRCSGGLTSGATDTAAACSNPGRSEFRGLLRIGRKHI